MKQPFIREMVRDSVAGFVNHPGGGGAASIIAGLFSAGQQGFWLPFTDFAGLTQDSAGTLPYTALEQPVGRVLDRSGRGNHASQVTSTARGVVSARVNLLQKTEDFNDPLWFKQAVGSGILPTLTNNYSAAPDGTMTAARVQLDLGGGNTFGDASRVGQLVGGGVAGNPRTMGWWAKSNTTPATVLIYDDFSGLVNTVITIGTAWQFVSFSGTLTGASSRAIPIWLRGGYGVSPSADLSIWHPQLQDSSTLSAYQRVTTATDYDAVGFPQSLRVEVDDFYTCGGGGSTTGFFFSDVVATKTQHSGVIFNDLLGFSGYQIAVLDTGRVILYVGTGTGTQEVSVALPAAGTRVHIAAWDDCTTRYLQLNGGTPVSVAAGPFSSGKTTIELFRTNELYYFNGQAIEPIYRAGPPPSAHERDVIRNYQMQKAGML